MTVSDVQAYVTYIHTKMELPTNYYKDRHLKINILFVKKIQMFVLSSIEDKCMNFETLYSKYNK